MPRIAICHSARDWRSDVNVSRVFEAVASRFGREHVLLVPIDDVPPEIIYCTYAILVIPPGLRGEQSAHRFVERRLRMLPLRKKWIMLVQVEDPSSKRGSERGFASMTQVSPYPVYLISQIRQMISSIEGSWGQGKPSADQRHETHDLVKCSVFAPSQTRPGGSVMVQVFVHLQEEEEHVRKIATTYDSTARARGGSFLNREVERGKQLTFCLNIPGAHVDEPIQRLAWRGIADSVQFGVTVPNEPQVGNLIGTVTVSDGTVPFGHVKFVMSVGDALTENTAKAAALAKQSWNATASPSSLTPLRIASRF